MIYVNIRNATIYKIPCLFRRIIIHKKGGKYDKQEN